MLFRIPRARVERPSPAKPVELLLGQVPGHQVTHAPRQQLDGIAGQTQGVWFEIVEGRDTTSDHNPKGGKNPEAERQNGLPMMVSDGNFGSFALKGEVN